MAFNLDDLSTPTPVTHVPVSLPRPGNNGITNSGNFGPAAEMAAVARDLEAQLAASVAATPINRPRADVLEVRAIDGTPAALALLELEPSSRVVGEPFDTDGEDVTRITPPHTSAEENAIAVAVADAIHAETPPTPKARRGRPRKNAGSALTPPLEHTPAQSTGEGTPDPKAAATVTSCAPSAGSPAACADAATLRCLAIELQDLAASLSAVAARLGGAS